MNSPDSVNFSGTVDLPGISDHKLIYCSYSLKKPKCSPQIIKRRDFRNFVKEKYIADMENANWPSVQNVLGNNIDEATANLENIFSNIINTNAPIREVKVTKPVLSSWMSDEVIFLMDLRDKYKAKWNEIKTNNMKHE